MTTTVAHGVGLIARHVDRRHPGEGGREEGLEPAADGVGGVKEVVDLLDGRTGYTAVV